jgi:hypothetical protein
MANSKSSMEPAHSLRRTGSTNTTWPAVVSATTTGPLQELAPGSPEEFILEHYWGYTPQSFGLSEYQALQTLEAKVGSPAGEDTFSSQMTRVLTGFRHLIHDVPRC